MYDATKHEALIKPANPELDLSPKNKAKLAAWEKAFEKNPKKCEVLRFMPSRKQYYEGGIRGVLWPGQTIHNTANGIPHVTPSDRYEITKDGYCPQSKPEAIRLLLLSQDPQNKICLHEDRELGAEARAPELKAQALQAEIVRKDEEIEELRRKLDAKGGR